MIGEFKLGVLFSFSFSLSFTKIENVTQKIWAPRMEQNIFSPFGNGDQKEGYPKDKWKTDVIRRFQWLERCFSNLITLVTYWYLLTYYIYTLFLSQAFFLG